MTAETIDGSQYTVTMGYDAAGRPSAMAYPNGLVAENVYTATGHLSQVKNQGSGLVYWEALAVDARGNVTSSRLGNGVQAAKSFEAATGFLTGINSVAPIGAGGAAIQDLDYAFDRLGNLTRRQDALANLDETFQYDSLNRVVEVATTTPGPGGVGTVTATVAVAYNRMGNIVSRSDVGAYTYAGTAAVPPGDAADPNCAVASARPHAVTGVAGTKTAAYCYDANGDLTSGDGRSVTWSSFGMPTRVAKGLRSIDLAYGPGRARFRRVDANETGITTTHYVAGGAFETATSQAGTVQRRLYVAGAAIVIDTVGLPAPAETRYLLRDHLGSLDVVLDSTGVVLERLSFDAWGKRRKVDWTAYLAAEPGYVWQSTPITRGYTGHEQLDPVGLVHMNGRVYDPEIGRFLSADIVIQDVTNLQSLNAYSYVLNNPLSFTDPSGFFFKSLFRAIGNFFRAVFRAIGGVLRAVVRSSIGRAIIQIIACAPVHPGVAATCGGATFGLTLAAGGSIRDAIKATAFAFVSMGVWKGVHILGDLIRTTGTLAHSLVHGVVGGALSVAQGGSFLHGFASSAIGDAGGLLSQSAFGAPGTGGAEGMFLRTAAAGAAGGIGAELSGGKFANGAVTAAFAQMYNAEGGKSWIDQIMAIWHQIWKGWRWREQCKPN